jgi:hypothetical protein
LNERCRSQTETKLSENRNCKQPQNGVMSHDGKKLAFTADNGVWVVPLQSTGNNIAGEPVRIVDIQGRQLLQRSAGRQMAMDRIILGTTKRITSIYLYKRREQRKVRLRHAKQEISLRLSCHRMGETGVLGLEPV